MGFWNDLFGGGLGSAVSVGATFLYFQPYLEALSALSDPSALLEDSLPLDSLPVPVPPVSADNPVSIPGLPFGAQK